MALGGHFFGPQCEGPKGIMHKASAALHYNLSPGTVYFVLWHWSKSGWQKLGEESVPVTQPETQFELKLKPEIVVNNLLPGLYRAYVRAVQDKAKGTQRYFCVGDPRQCEASMKQVHDALLPEAIMKLGPVAPPKKRR